MSDTKTDLAALVAAYQSGTQPDPLPIWDAVHYFVKRQAGRFLARSGITCADLEDLMQSGFIALLSALETYQPDAGAFLPWLANYLTTEFYRAANGGRSIRHEHEPANRAVSIFAELSEDGETILDTIPDPEDKYAAAEDLIYQEQLHEALEQALDKLPRKHAQILRAYYWQGLTQAEIARERGCAPQYVSACLRQALRALRARADKRIFRDFCEIDLYAGTGLQTYRKTGTSATERAAIKRTECRDATEELIRREKAIIADLLARLDKIDPGAK